MSQKTKHEASMSRLPGNRSAKFVPYLIPGLIGLFAVVVVPFIWNIYLSFTRWHSPPCRASAPWKRPRWHRLRC